MSALISTTTAAAGERRVTPGPWRARQVAESGEHRRAGQQRRGH